MRNLVFSRSLWLYVLAASTGGCLVNPVPTPEGSGNVFDKTTDDDTAGGSGGGGTDAYTPNLDASGGWADSAAADVAAGTDAMGEDAAADIAADVTADVPGDVTADVAADATADTAGDVSATEDAL